MTREVVASADAPGGFNVDDMGVVARAGASVAQRSSNFGHERQGLSRDISASLIQPHRFVRSRRRISWRSRAVGD